MPERTALTFLIVAISSIAVAGCGGDMARSAQPAQTSPAAVAEVRKADPATLAARHPHPHKEPQHEAFLSTYHNPEQGISFLYPRNYSLEEGDVEEHSFFLKRQEDLDTEQPGAALLATVLIPEDGYPNTTFEHGSVQLLANEVGTEKACRETGPLAFGGSSVKTITVQGIAFRGREQESETAGTKVLERVYAGYSAGTCYEFLLTVAAEDAPEPDGFKRPADTAKIMKHLEKIVASATIFAKSAPPAESKEEESTDRL